MARVNAIGTEFVESDVDDIVRTPSIMMMQIRSINDSFELEISKR
jgi:hypothetical protein